jgi:hypothetical protein
MEMDQYLFLFPVREYLSAGEYFSFAMRDIRSFDAEVGRMDRIIRARYGRGSGYETNWLLFSSPDDRCAPDLSSLDARMPEAMKGRMLVSGVTFEECTREERYFDPDHVLSQLPRTGRLVLGGFHDADCVERMAEGALAAGIDATIDEDTTDMFFHRRALGIRVPVKRGEWRLSDFGMTERQGAPEWMIDSFKEVRRGKPYRVAVRS